MKQYLSFLFFVVAAPSIYAQYCAPDGDCVEDVASVSVNDQTNFNTTNCATEFGNTYFENDTFKIPPTVPAQITVNAAPYVDGGTEVFVDWNEDEQFSTDELTKLVGTEANHIGLLLPPNGVTEGVFRMRVLYGIVGSTSMDGCQNQLPFGYSRVLDYPLEVTEEEISVGGEYCPASSEPACASIVTNGTEEDSSFTFIDVVNIPDDNGAIRNTSLCDEYGDYTNLIATWTAGMPYVVSVSNGSFDDNGNYVSEDARALALGSVYIDWNNDFSFSQDETYPLGPNLTDSMFVSIIPPLTAATGLYRMRIVTTLATATPTPCGETSNGEVEDYTIFIQDPAAPVPECAELIAPADMADNQCSSLEFVWTTAEEADSYNLVISELGSDNEFRFDGLTDTTQSVSNLPANSDFEWEVEAVNENGQSFGCEVFTFSTGNANPTAAFDAASVSVCPNESFTFGAVISGGDAPYDFTWSGDGAAFLDDVNAEMPNLANPSPGVYTLSVSVTDARGCQSNTASQELVIKSVLQAEDIELLNPVACSNEDIKFVYNANFNAVFQESDDNVTFTDFPPNYLSGDTVLYNQPNAGEKFIRAIVTSNGCSDTSAVVTQERLAPLAEAEIDFFAGEAVNCPEDEVAMQAANYDSDITWSNGATTDTITITESGSYSYTYTDANGCSTTSEAIDVTVVELDAPLALNVTADTVALCEGEALTLAINNENAVWNDANNTANDTLVVSTEGLYKATVTKDGCAFVSDSVFVQVNPTPAPIALDFDSEQSLCAGTDSLVITGVEGMEWTVPAGVTTTSITVFESGSYFGSITNEFGCTALSDTADVVFNEAPAQPEITREDSILFVEGAEGNARIWILDGTNISINDTIALDEPGEYQVVLVSEEGCISDTSDVFLFDPNGIQESLAEAGIQVYPVPTTNNTVYLKTEQNVSFRLISADGRLLEDGAVAFGTTGQIAVPTQGYYFLHVSTEGASWTVKLLSN